MNINQYAVQVNNKMFKVSSRSNEHILMILNCGKARKKKHNNITIYRKKEKAFQIDV